MIVFIFDGNFPHEYLGPYRCPASPEEPGKFLKPVNCLEVEPMPAEVGKARVAVDGAWQKIPDVRGAWYKPNGDVVILKFLTDTPENDWTREPLPPSEEEQMAAAILAVKLALQSVIDSKAIALGFSGGNALMLYVSFENAFKETATDFAIWEASVWVEAGLYRAEVLAGNQPMLTPEQAVAMMPVYPSE